MLYKVSTETRKSFWRRKSSTSQTQGHPGFSSSPNRRRGFKNRGEGFFFCLIEKDCTHSEKRETLVWSDLCTDCSEESFEPVNQENDAFTVKCVNMISAFFQSSTVVRGYFPSIIKCGVTTNSVYQGTRWHRVTCKALRKQHNLALYPPFFGGWS